MQQTFQWTWPATRRVSRALRLQGFFDIIESGDNRQVNATAVRSVLSAVEDHAGVNGWCTTTNDTLAGEASVKLSQCKRALAVLDKLGLIIRSTSRAGGRMRRRIRPNWDHYLDSEFCSLSPCDRELLRDDLHLEATEAEVPVSKAEVPERRPEVPESKAEVPESKAEVPLEGPVSYREDNRLRKRSLKTKYRYRSIGLKISDSQLDWANELVDRISSAVDLSRCKPGYDPSQNWDMVAKIAVMVALGEMPEAWLMSALQSIRGKSESVSVGYLASCLRNKFREAGGDLGQALRHVILPTQLEFQA
jgi:hypothetical protein